MHQLTKLSLIQKIAHCWISTKLLSKPILAFYQMNILKQNSVKFESKYNSFHKWIPAVK